MEKKRLFLGGLYQGMSEKELTDRFSRFGSITSISMKEKKSNTGEDVKTFAYFDLYSTEQNLKKCISTFNKTKWRGNELKLQLAKENFLDRLRKEQETARESLPEELPDGNDIAVHSTTRKSVTPGEKNWVVDKFGKPIPVVYIRKKDKSKVMKVDPTKFKHSVKKIKDEGTSNFELVDNLTWEIEEKDKEKTKKRIGEFPKSQKGIKRRSLIKETAVKVTCKPTEQLKEQSKADSSLMKETVQEFEIVCAMQHSKQAAKFNNTTIGFGGYNSDSADSADTDEIISTFRTNFSSNSTTSGSIHDNLDVKHSKKMSGAKSIETKKIDTEQKDQLHDRNELDNNYPTCIKSNVKTTKYEDALVSLGPEFSFLFETDSEDSDQEKAGKHKRKKKGNKTNRNVPEFKGTKRIKEYHTDQSASDQSISKCWLVKPENTKDSKASVVSSAIEMSHVGDFDVISSHATVKDGKPNDMDFNRFDSSSASHSDSEGINITDDKQENDKRTEKVVAASAVTNEITLQKVQKAKKSNSEIFQSTNDVLKKAMKEKNIGVNKEESNVKKKTKKQKTIVLTKEEKRVSADQKRLETLKQRQNENKAQKSTIKQALAAVDSAPKNKRVVFDSDSDDHEYSTSYTARALTAEKSKKDASSVSRNSALFDSSSENSDSEMDQREDEEMFSIKPQFQGKKGEKLMYLQSRYKNDERFKLTKQFMESDSEDENEDTGDIRKEVSVMNDETLELETEKKRALQILKDVVGSKVVGMEKKEKTVTFRDISALHFDPTKEEHKKFEILPDTKEAKKRKEKEKKKSKNNDITEEIELPDVSKEKYFEVSTSLTSVFGQKGSGMKFSFLGNNDEDFNQDDNSDADESISVAEKDTTLESLPWQQPLSSFDTSGDEQELLDREDVPMSTITEHACAKATKGTFFFQGNDSRLLDGIKLFHRTESLDALREKWVEKRPQLIEDYRMKHKKALRRNKTTISFKKRQAQRK